MKRAVLVARDSWIAAADLGLEAAEVRTLKDAVREAERRALSRAWAEADGNVSKASRLRT